MNVIRTFCAAAAATLALSMPLFAQGPEIAAHDAYARAGGIGKSGAVFLMIDNTGHEDDRLIAARSDVAARVELHTHKDMGDGVMKMMEVEEGFAVPAGGSHALARGGDHVMLMGLTRDLADGDTFPLTLVFEKSGEVVIDVPVDNARKPEAAMQHGEGMGGHSGHGTAHGG